MANQLDQFKQLLQSRVSSLVKQGKSREEALSQIESSIKGIQGGEQFVRGLIAGEDVSGMVPGLQQALGREPSQLQPTTGEPKEEKKEETKIEVPEAPQPEEPKEEKPETAEDRLAQFTLDKDDLDAISKGETTKEELKADAEAKKQQELDTAERVQREQAEMQAERTPEQQALVDEQASQSFFDRMVQGQEIGPDEAIDPGAFRQAKERLEKVQKLINMTPEQIKEQLASGRLVKGSQIYNDLIKANNTLVQEAEQAKQADLDLEGINLFIQNLQEAVEGAQDTKPDLSDEAARTEPPAQPEGIEEEIQASDFLNQYAQSFFEDNGDDAEDIINNIDSSALTRERDTLLGLERQVRDLDVQMDNITDDLRQEMRGKPGVTDSYIAAKAVERTRDLMKQRRLLTNQVLEQQGRVGLLVEEAKAANEASERNQKFKQDQMKFGFDVAKAMQERADKFLLQKLSREDKEAMAGISLENQKELARYKEELAESDIDTEVIKGDGMALLINSDTGLEIARYNLEGVTGSGGFGRRSSNGEPPSWLSNHAKAVWEDNSSLAGLTGGSSDDVIEELQAAGYFNIYGNGNVDFLKLKKGDVNDLAVFLQTADALHHVNALREAGASVGPLIGRENFLKSRKFRTMKVLLEKIVIAKVKEMSGTAVAKQERATIEQTLPKTDMWGGKFDANMSTALAEYEAAYTRWMNNYGFDSKEELRAAIGLPEINLYDDYVKRELSKGKGDKASDPNTGGETVNEEQENTMNDVIDNDDDDDDD